MAITPAPTFDDLYNTGKAEAQLKRPLLGFRFGDLTDIVVAAAAAMADRVVGWFAERIAASFLDGAQGDDLTKLVADHWYINRFLALPSQGAITITRSSADATSQVIVAGMVIATAKDSTGAYIAYVTQADAAWGISVNGTQTVPVNAQIAGISGNLSASNLITSFLGSLPAGGSYAITASTQPAGGSEDETDDALRDRARKYPSTLRRGTLPAIEYGATQTPNAGVAKSNAIQDSTGLITVYISDASGNCTGTLQAVSRTLVDDGTMTTRVAIELVNWACAGAFVNVTGGAVQTVNIAVQISVRLGVDATQLVAAIIAAITARVNKLTIGQTLYVSDIINSTKAVDPDNITNVIVISPAADVVPSSPGNLIQPGTVGVN